MNKKYLTKTAGTSLVEVLITLSIVSFVFASNIVLLLHVVTRVNYLENEVQEMMR